MKMKKKEMLKEVRDNFGDAESGIRGDKNNLGTLIHSLSVAWAKHAESQHSHSLQNDKFTDLDIEETICSVSNSATSLANVHPAMLSHALS